MERIEALLFIAGKWLSEVDIVRIIGIDPISLREKIEKLKQKYNEMDSSIIIREMEKDGIKHWKMDVKEEYKHYASKLAIGKSEFTKAETETLALIAYKQPIKQSIVVKIRGNKAYEHIKKFVIYGLVNAKKYGHTYILSLTDKFYEYFDVKKKNENITKNLN